MRSVWLVVAVVLGMLLCGQARAADVIRVGDGPFITGGGYFIAREKGYFHKVGIEIQPREFQDGSMSVPAMIAGELEFSGMTAAASLFNSVAKGAPLVVILDRANNRPGFGYTVMNVTQALYDQGVHGLADFAKLKGKRFGVGAVGSINQYNLAQALLKIGLDPANDVQWTVNVPQPDLMNRCRGDGPFEERAVRAKQQVGTHHR